MNSHVTKQNNRPVGLLGGTFNPIHLGHIALARQAYTEFQLDKVIVMPCGNPPHKPKTQILDAVHRCNMVKLAIQNYPELEYSDYEVTRTAYSYSYKTLEAFNERYPNIYFIIGADSLLHLRDWVKPERIMELATIVVARRDQHSLQELEDCANSLRADFNAQILFMHLSDIPISSSEIRERIGQQQDISAMLNEDVAHYIAQNGLYQG